MKLKRTYILLFAITIAFFGCKKYPENKLVFKDPENCFKGGLITMYTINGVDHINDITALYKYFPYNYYGKAIEDALQQPFSFNKTDGLISCEYGEGGFAFSGSKREIEISFKPLNFIYGAQNIFIANASWKILKLTKSGQLKIQAYINTKTYIIQFN